MKIKKLKIVNFKSLKIRNLRTLNLIFIGVNSVGVFDSIFIIIKQIY